MTGPWSARVMWVSCLCCVVLMPRVTFAQSGPAADADQLARIMKSFEGTTEVRYESFERPEAAAACGPSPLFSSMFHKLSTTLDGDQESRDRIETLRRSFTDPQAAARLGREEVRRLLDRRGLPLEPVGGTVVEYPSARRKGRGAPPASRLRPGSGMTRSRLRSRKPPDSSREAAGWFPSSWHTRPAAATTPSPWTHPTGSTSESRRIASS